MTMTFITNLLVLLLIFTSAVFQSILVAQNNEFIVYINRISIVIPERQNVVKSIQHL